MTPDPSPGRWLDDADFVRLTSAFSAGTATLADRDRLESLLADPRARDAYRLSMQVHADLAWRWNRQEQRGGVQSPARRGRDARVAFPAATKPTSKTKNAPPERPAAATVFDPLWSWHRWIVRQENMPIVILAMLMAAAIGLAAIGPWIQSGMGEARIEFGSASGRIMATHEAVWQGSGAAGGAAPQPGDLLAAGTKLSLAGGLVEIAQPCGARIILEGPCTFTIAAGDSLAIERGRLTASLGKSKQSSKSRLGTPLFTVRTPTAVVTDLGTAFGVDVHASGQTDVQVFEGLVEVASRRLAGDSPLRLAAGEAVRAAVSKGVERIAAAAAWQFVRWMPKGGRRVSAASPGGIQWDESRAVTMYRDSFAGSGPLVGTTPASRGGVGNAAWAAPAKGWTIDRSGPGLSVKAGGAAFLPFRPEPGFIYRLSVAMDVTAGGSGWAAIGFTEQSNVEEWILDRGWMLQRHDVRSAKGRAVSLPNVAYAGPRQTGRVGDGDEFCGPRTRTVILDTTGPTWRAVFLVGEELVGECRFDDRPDTIRHVALSVFPDTSAVFHSFSLQSLSSFAASERR